MDVFSSLRLRMDLLRLVRGAAVLALSVIGSVSFAAKYYNPLWGPAPPADPHNMKPLPRQRVIEPIIFPLIGKCHWNDDYTANRGGFLHAAIDIKAPKMTPIVAPFPGIIGLKAESFWIYGDDGWIMLGTHLNNDNPGTHDRAGCRDVMFAPDLVGGQHVYAGQFIGYVGMSGNATGPHLHFELYAPGAGPTAVRVRNPFPSLKAAQVIGRPRLHLDGAKPPQGQIRVDGCIRKIDAKHSRLTLVLFGKQSSTGTTAEVLGPRYVRFNVPPAAVENAGGWSRLESLSQNAPVGCYLAYSTRLDDATIIRLVAPEGTQTLARSITARRQLALRLQGRRNRPAARRAAVLGMSPPPPWLECLFARNSLAPASGLMAERRSKLSARGEHNDYNDLCIVQRR